MRCLALVAVALVLGGLAGAAVTPLAIEDALLTRLVAYRSPALTTAAHVVTVLGDLWLVVAVAAVVGLLVRHRPEATRIRLLLVLGIGGATGTVAALKLVVARARPEVALVSTWTSAYPSGHAARAAAGYGLVIWACHRYLRHHRGLRLAGTTAGVAVILAVAWSRVQLGVHLPSDVVVGLLIGAAWFLAVVRAVPPSATVGIAERLRGAPPTRAVRTCRAARRSTATTGWPHGVDDTNG